MRLPRWFDRIAMHACSRSIATDSRLKFKGHNRDVDVYMQQQSNRRKLWSELEMRTLLSKMFVLRAIRLASINFCCLLLHSDQARQIQEASLEGLLHRFRPSVTAHHSQRGERAENLSDSACIGPLMVDRRKLKWRSACQRIKYVAV